MGASVEWLCPEHGILRAGPEHADWRERHPYDYACYVVRQGETALLCGTTDVRRAIPHREEIAAVLVGAGFTAVAWERAGRTPVRFELRLRGDS